MEISYSPQANEWKLIRLRRIPYLHSSLLTLHFNHEKSPPPQSLGTKGKPSAVPPKFILTEYALDAPVTEGGPAVSPRRLPGEPNRASAVWLAAGGQTSLGGVSRLFSRSSLITINTYSTETGQMQAPIRRNSADRGGNFQLKSRPSTRSSTWMADTTPSVMKKEMCLQ